MDQKARYKETIEGNDSGTVHQELKTEVDDAGESAVKKVDDLGNLNPGPSYYM